LILPLCDDLKLDDLLNAVFIEILYERRDCFMEIGTGKGTANRDEKTQDDDPERQCTSQLHDVHKRGNRKADRKVLSSQSKAVSRGLFQQATYYALLCPF